MDVINTLFIIGLSSLSGLSRSLRYVSSISFASIIIYVRYLHAVGFHNCDLILFLLMLHFP